MTPGLQSAMGREIKQEGGTESPFTGTPFLLAFFLLASYYRNLQRYRKVDKVV